jgi:Protein of unknown function (DUF3306)
MAKRLRAEYREQAVTETSNVFLRWARLKQQAKTAPRSESATTDIDSAAPQAGPDAAKNEPVGPASLPSIDAITADTDIIAFLQSGVPAELTRAALRRAWTSDPAICDFIGVAENQWDFNDPNGIPGFGPLGTMQGQVACLSQAPPSLKKIPDLLAGKMNPLARDSKAVQSEQSAVDQRAHRVSGDLHSTPVSSPDFREAHAEAENEDAVGRRDASGGGRTHGSALPR